MMKSKFILKRLVLSGENKKNAILNFEEGLNVIAGASDTGKSFAFDCINYGFGASNVPALPPEAEGYNSVYLELETLNKDVFTIRRDFNDKNNAYWIYSNFDDINSNASFEKIKAESKTDKNISEKILSICGCNYKNLLKKISTGETKKFTFRDFVPLIMVNEGRITQKYSPVHRTSPRGNTLAVSEWTAFQTIVTGEDYLKTTKAESADVIKSRIKGQIQELELLCAELKTEIEELKGAVAGTSVDELDKQIEELQTAIDEKKEYLLSKEEEYCTLIKRLKEADYEKQRISDNVCKFHLLMENYKSDIERLEFIEEAHNVTEQLLEVECPVCHAIRRSIFDVKQKELCHKAFRAEKKKIEILIEDLKATIENAEINKLNIETQNEKMLEDINRLVNDMNESLRPVIDSKLEEISGLLEKRELWSTMYANDFKLKKYEDRIAELESSKVKVANKSKGSVKDISQDKLLFCKLNYAPFCKLFGADFCYVT